MSLDLHLKYNLGDKVYITELELYGTVVSIWIMVSGIKYEIRYFHNGEAREVYFTEDELTIKLNNKIGFKLKEK